MRVSLACCLMLGLSSALLATTPEDVRVFANNGDIPALANQLGHHLLSSDVGESEQTFWLKKGTPQ